MLIFHREESTKCNRLRTDSRLQCCLPRSIENKSTERTQRCFSHGLESIFDFDISIELTIDLAEQRGSVFHQHGATAQYRIFNKRNSWCVTYCGAAQRQQDAKNGAAQQHLDNCTRAEVNQYVNNRKLTTVDPRNSSTHRHQICHSTTIVNL